VVMHHRFGLHSGWWPALVGICLAVTGCGSGGPSNQRTNTAPTAAFTVTPGTGTTATTFQFDGSGSTDAEDGGATLQVRWDWTNDGTFDTTFSTTKTAGHRYTTAGTFTSRMEVRDSGGLTGTTTRSVTVACGGGSAVSVLFIHHSVGNDLVERGDVRGQLAAYDAAYGTSIAFWDHEYNSPGLRNPAGEWVGSYNIPGDNTDPDGYFALWTGADAQWLACRNQILNNHRVIAFKSCYPASRIESDAQLAQYRAWYLAMRGFFDTRTDRHFIVVSPPPLHRLSNHPAWAARARAFADWLGSDAYLSGHPNVHCYDLFDAFAKADDGSPTANTLKYQYEGSHEDGDSHPNSLADETVGPALARFVGDIVSGL